MGGTFSTYVVATISLSTLQNQVKLLFRIPKLIFQLGQ
jgi:hypothetical protein